MAVNIFRGSRPHGGGGISRSGGIYRRAAFMGIAAVTMAATVLLPAGLALAPVRAQEQDWLTERRELETIEKSVEDSFGKNAMGIYLPGEGIFFQYSVPAPANPKEEAQEKSDYLALVLKKIGPLPFLGEQERVIVQVRQGNTLWLRELPVSVVKQLAGRYRTDLFNRYYTFYKNGEGPADSIPNWQGLWQEVLMVEGIVRDAYGEGVGTIFAPGYGVLISYHDPNTDPEVVRRHMATIEFLLSNLQQLNPESWIVTEARTPEGIWQAKIRLRTIQKARYEKLAPEDLAEIEWMYNGSPI